MVNKASRQDYSPSLQIIMSQHTNNYVIASEEFPALHAFMNLQRRVGSGTTLSSPEDVPDYFSHMIYLNWMDTIVKNPELKKLCDILFNTMRKFPDYAEISIVSRYYWFYRSGPQYQIQQHISIVNSDFSISFPDNWQIFRSSFSPPPTNGQWKTDVERIMTTWGDRPPAAYIVPKGDPGSGKTSSDIAKIKIDRWSGEIQVPRNAMAPMESELKKTIDVMMKESSFSVDSYFLLFYFLIGLANSNGDDRSLALRIVNRRVDANEYPNDFFINHLVYIVLMALIDPKGIYRLNNEQIKSKLKEINTYIVRTDGAAQMMKQSINESLDVLNADPSYPMHDAEYPNISFSTRKADILEALDTARQNIML